MARVATKLRRAKADALDVGEADGRLMQSLARGLSVLRAFRPGETSLSNAELAQRTGLTRPSVSRLTETLVALGYLTIVPRTGRYELGGGVVALCHSLLAGMPHRIAARSVLQDLADHSRLPASLGMRDQLEMVNIETARHPHMRPARFDLGSRLPIAQTSMGRAYLYGLPQDEREALLQRLRSLSDGAQWAILEPRIEAAFESIAKHGFCVSLGDRLPDVFAVGAPVVTAEGAVLAVNCGGLPSEVTADRLQNDIGPRLALAARQISMECGADA